MMGGGMFHGVSRGHPDEQVFGDVYDQRVVARLLPYIMPYKRLTAFAFISMLIYTGTQVAVPWIIAVSIDDYIIPGDFAGPTWLLALFFVIAVVNWIVN